MVRRPLWSSSSSLSSSSTIPNIFSSETTWPIKAKFYVEPPLEGGTKVYINGPGHLTKMAAMPIILKTFKNLLQKQKSCDLETWHVALGTQAELELELLYKPYINDDPGLTLTYFMARSNWVAYTFEWGKLLQSHLMGEILQQRTILTE